jgi:hypothetical protein
MAEQTTTLQTIAPNQYTLKDITKGTRGLASLTGFEREEVSKFQYADEQIIAIEHEMQQKVAFKNKTYRFKALADTTNITGHDKQSFSLTSTLKPISSHMLPLWLSTQVCNETKQTKKKISVAVLKSKRIKTYEFNVFDEAPLLTRIDRIYPPGVNRNSQIWLDKNNHCLPIKTRHQEDDEPVIETKLLTHHLIDSEKPSAISHE